MARLISGSEFAVYRIGSFPASIPTISDRRSRGADQPTKLVRSRAISKNHEFDQARD